MQLNDLVCAVEYSKELVRLGVKDKSLYRWYELPYRVEFNRKTNEQKIVETEFKLSWHENVYFGDEPISNYPAYTAAELGEILLPCVRELEFSYLTDKQEYYYLETFKLQEGFSAKTEADCRAKMLIHLLENNLLTLECKE